MDSWVKYSQQVLDPFDAFGASVAGLGDLDGDGVGDVAVGAPGDGDAEAGAVWILFLNADGTVRSKQKISAISGWFEADFFVDRLGAGVAGLGDLDGDGVPDLAVAATGTQTTGGRIGAVWILFLEPDGTVKSWQKIAPLGLLGGSQLADSVACLGDVDGDGVVDLALGHMFASYGALYQGAVWLLFLRSDGTLKGERRISGRLRGVSGDLSPHDNFGISVASPGDLDGDGVPELAVGAYGDDDGDTDQGAVWILFLRANGSVRSMRKISATAGGFGGDLDPGDRFGSSVCALGDLDGDGIGDLAVGALLDDDGGTDKGAVWILHLTAAGKVKSWRKISEAAGGFQGTLEEDPHYSSDNFGAAIARLGDLDGDGFDDLAVGTPGHGTVAGDNTDMGATWILRMSTDATVVAEHRFVGETRGWGSGRWVNGKFGSSTALLDDIDGDGVRDVAVGVPDGGSTLSSFSYGKGGVWILFLNADGTVKATQHMGVFSDGGFQGPLDHLDAFGCALASLGDLDGDGIGDLAAGARGDDDGGPDKGAVWILFLNADGSVKAEQKISASAGGFGDVLSARGRFGCALASLADLDGDGLTDLAVGCDADDDGGTNRGALWILFLNADGTVKSEAKVSQTAGGFAGALDANDAFGSSVANLGDLDGDGIVDLAAGAVGDDDGGGNRGALWVLFLDADGRVKSEAKISDTSGVVGPLNANGAFGGSVACLDDLDGDGVAELAVGESSSDAGGTDQGAVWILFMNADGTVWSEQKIAESTGGFGGQLSGDRFGASVIALDLDGDGARELLVGASYDDDLGQGAGALWGLYLER